MSVHWQDISSPAVLAAAVAAHVAEAMDSALKARGRASLACSGGSTPRMYLPAIAALPLDWSRITITLVDERFVAPDHPASNVRMLRDVLLHGPAAAARLVSLMPDGLDADADPVAVAARADAALASIEHPYDLVLLGMGEDGHFASLVPHTAQLDAALDPAQTARCVAVEAPHTVLPQVPRLSMTLTEMRRSRAHLLVFQGVDKRAVFEAARASGDPHRWPVAALIGASDPPRLDVLWCP